MRPRRAIALVLALLLVLLGLAGCATIPTRGAVATGAPQNDPGNGLSVLPATPKPGASPQDIVANFLSAGTGQQNDYGAARRFLAPSFAARWRPGAGVLVQSGGGRVLPGGTGATTVRYSVPVAARIDARGIYTPVAAATPRLLTFRLAKVRGEWRITRAPDGVVLAADAVDRLFPRQPLAFFDPAFARTVPDQRWFPTGASRSIPPTAIVRALLAGPAAPLVGAAVTAFPKGTTLRRGVLTVGGAALVDLAIPGPEPGALALQRMKAQLTGSLQVAQVSLEVDGVGRAVSDVQPEATTPLDPRPLVVRGASVGHLDGERVVADPVVGAAVGRQRVLGLTVSDSRRLAAIRTAKGVTLVGPSGTRLVDRRPGLVDPALDPEGWVYSVSGNEPSVLRAFDGRGSSNLSLNLSEGTTVQALEVAPEGARLLVLTDGDSGARAFVVGILRNARGAPVAVTRARFPVATAAGTAIDATWVDPVTVATVVKTQTGDDAVRTQVVGGVDTALGRLANASGLVGATKETDITALLDNGNLATRRGSVWIPSSAGVQVLGVQR